MHNLSQSGGFRLQQRHDSVFSMKQAQFHLSLSFCVVFTHRLLCLTSHYLQPYD